MKATEEMINSMMTTALLLTIYTFSKIHVMNNLLIIEFTTISILKSMFTTTTMMEMENFLVLFFIIIVICESMIGLSMMIALIRTNGNDTLKSISTMKF